MHLFIHCMIFLLLSAYQWIHRRLVNKQYTCTCLITLHIRLSITSGIYCMVHISSAYSWIQCRLVNKQWTSACVFTPHAMISWFIYKYSVKVMRWIASVKLWVCIWDGKIMMKKSVTPSGAFRFQVTHEYLLFQFRVIFKFTEFHAVHLWQTTSQQGILLFQEIFIFCLPVLN